MKDLAFKNRVVEIGDRLGIILSQSSGNVELYRLAKELYTMTKDLIEDIEDKEESTGFFKIERESKERSNEKVEILEKNLKLLNEEQRKIKLSIDELLKIVGEHDYILSP